MNIKGLVALTFLLVAAFPGRASAQEQKPPEFIILDEKHDTNTWVNRTGEVYLAVNVYLTRGAEGRSYLPLEIAVANPGEKGVTLTRDSFTLYDQAGNAFPAATPKELVKNYGRLVNDRTKMTRSRSMTPVFQGYNTMRSQFAPNPRMAEGVSNVVTDRVDIPSGYMIMDLLYFKMPVTNLTGKYLELRVVIKGIEAPQTIKFMVDLPKK